jgi:hypothetical protein
MVSTYYRIEVKLFQNVIFGAGMVGTRRVCVIETNAIPLIDGESFVCVHEPGDVTKPIEIDGHRTITEKETTKEQQRDDERWT